MELHFDNRYACLIYSNATATDRPVVPAYTAVDLRYGWRMRPEPELSVILRNAFDEEHAEFTPAATRSEIARQIYAKLDWRY